MSSAARKDVSVPLPVGMPRDLSPLLHEVVRVPLDAASEPGYRAWKAGPAFPRRVRVVRLEDGFILDFDVMAVHLPRSAFDLEGFLDWAWSDAFPRHGRITFTPEGIRIDMSPEELNLHNEVKTEVMRVVANVNVENDLGRVYTDGCLVKNSAAGLSTEPDGVFVSWNDFDTGRAKLVVQKQRKQRQPKHQSWIEGSPDWVLEVVSESSRHEDYREMRDLYHRAGVQEYWIIDARGDELVFLLLSREKNRYRQARPRDGWLTSKVLGRRFRLARQTDRLGSWQYRLGVEEEKHTP